MKTEGNAANTARTTCRWGVMGSQSAVQSEQGTGCDYFWYYNRDKNWPCTTAQNLLKFVYNALTTQRPLRSDPLIDFARTLIAFLQEH